MLSLVRKILSLTYDQKPEQFLRQLLEWTKSNPKCIIYKDFKGLSWTKLIFFCEQSARVVVKSKSQGNAFFSVDEKILSFYPHRIFFQCFLDESAQQATENLKQGRSNDHWWEERSGQKGPLKHPG